MSQNDHPSQSHTGNGPASSAADGGTDHYGANQQGHHQGPAREDAAAPAGPAGGAPPQGDQPSSPDLAYGGARPQGLSGWLHRLLGERGAMLLPQAKLAGPMRWVIAIMVALTVIASAGGLSLSNLVSGARAELSGGVTVQIIEPLLTEREREVEGAEAALSAFPGIAEVRRVPDDELDALLEPWLGADAGSETVPIPALLDVRLEGPVSEQRLEGLRSQIQAAAPSARVDAQSDWLEPVFSAINALQWLAIALIVLLAVTSAAAVWLAARSALGSNRDTIEIIHLLGGTDNQVARIFQRSVGIDAALGGAAGLAIGLLVVFIFARQFAALNSGVVGNGGLGWLDWILIVLVPVGGVIIAVWTARLTVLAALRRML